MTTNTNMPKRDSKDLSRELKEDISKVKEDLNQIAKRMTPGQIIDDALYSRTGYHGPGETFDHLKSSPIGTAFLTLGTLLLMEDENHESMERKAYHKVSEVKDKAKIKAYELKNKAMDKIDDLRASTDGMQDFNMDNMAWNESFEANDGMNQEAIREKIEGKVDELKEKFHGVAGKAEEIKDMVGEAKSTLREKSTEVMDKVRGLDPLAYIALGAGLGVVTSSAIPVLNKEKNFVGKFQGKFAGFGQELKDALNESVNILKKEFLSELGGGEVRLFT